MDLLPAPFHFAATFLVTVAAFGGTWVTIYRPKFVPDGSVRRFFFGMGWLLLAIGEALHGSQIIASEQNAGITVLRLTAYVMIVAGLQPLIRGKPVEPDEERPPVQGGPLGAEGPSPQKTPVVPAVRRLILALALFAASEVMFVSVDSLSSEEPGTLWLVVHGLRLAGGLAVLAWLGQVVRTSIQARVVAVFIGLMLVVVVAISGSMTQIFSANITEESLQQARREAEVQQRLLDAQISDSVSQAQQVAKLDSFRETFATRVDVLRPLVSTLQESGGAFDTADFVACLNPTGALLAISATGPGGTSTLEVAELLGLVGTNVVQDALKNQGGGSVDSVSPDKIAAIGAIPVNAPGTTGTQVGVVIVGRLIDRDYLEAQQPAGGEAFLINRTSVIDGTASVADGVIPTNPAQLASLFDQGSRLALETTIGGAEYFSSYIPLVRANEVIGALVFSTPSDVVGLAQRNLATPLFFIALWATVMGIGLSLLFGSRITQPIRDLTDAAEKVRQGDLSIRVSPRTFDEVGVLGETFDQMTASLGALTADLTDTAEEQMQLRRQLETILQSMTDGMVAVDNQGAIVAFNREAERILEVKQSEAVGKRVDEVLLLRDAEGALMSPSIYDLRKGAVSGTVGGPRQSARPVIVTSAPIEDENGEVLGAVAVVRDLTREVEIENMKTEFLANISHELRTPITPIKGYADILRRKEVPRAQAVTFLEGILSSAERLERIVEMLVDFSAMEAGRLSPHKVVVDFDQITADLVGKWSQASPKHQFERKGFESLPTVRADRRLVPLAIGELVDNAVKFSPNGGKVTIAADYSENGRGAGNVLISVTDEGIGIGEDQLLRIGQNFVQADGSETRAYGGLGLGLAYVRRIVEGHGGRLEVRSEPSKGSCFTLVFPAGS
jgi:PAS domain S-box-containing protein